MKSIQNYLAKWTHIVLLVVVTVSLVSPTQNVYAARYNPLGFFDRVMQGAGDLDLVDYDLAERAECAAKINAYYSQWDLPLAGYGHVFVYYAEKYDIECTLVAAIAMRESTGGKKMFAEYNAFGWGNKVEFKSFEQSIAYVSKSLGGYHPGTERYYKGKTTKEKLMTYNPPSVVYDYSEQVMRIMDKIENMEVEEDIYILS